MKFLYKLLCEYGSCDIHITNQGKEIVNSISEEFYCLTSMYKHTTSHYHPQANGLIEC